MAKRHKCKRCIYFFKGSAQAEKMIYNALSDRFVQSPEMEEVAGCGYNEEAIILDKDQPPCHNFIDKADKGYSRVKQLGIEELQEQFEAMFEETLEKDNLNYKENYINEEWKSYLVCAITNKILKEGVDGQ